MTPENFIYWLNGYLELSNREELGAFQVKMIKDHLALVLTKVTAQVKEPWAAKIPPRKLCDSGSTGEGIGANPDQKIYC